MFIQSGTWIGVIGLVYGSSKNHKQRKINPMGMGYAAGHVVSIDISAVKRICPTQLRHFNEMKEVVGDIVVSRVIEYQMDDELPDDCKYKTIDVLALHEAVVSKFRVKTGLTIGYFYHNSADEGDRYDDIGECWVVDNAYKLTDAARPFKKHIRTQNFVQFG
jgi:hypothetical protein